MRLVHFPREVTTEAKHAQAQARGVLVYWLWSTYPMRAKRAGDIASRGKAHRIKEVRVMGD